MYFIDNTSRVVSNYIQDSIRTVALLRWHDCHCEIPSQVFANYPIPAMRLYEFKQSDDDDDEAWQKDRETDGQTDRYHKMQKGWNGRGEEP